MFSMTERVIDWSRESRTHLYDSNMEDEALVSKEGVELSDLYRTLQARHRKLKRLLTALSLLLSLACITLLLSFWNATAIDRFEGPLSPVPQSKSYSLRFHCTSSNQEIVPIVPVKFERNDRYAAPSTPESDQAWGSLSPPGDGFIYVNNSASYNLQPGKQTPKGEVYDISLFHQIHCLAHIRTYAFTLKAGMMHNNTREVYDILLRKQEDHVYHCFDYIRQAIMCAGDMTIEWPREEADGRRFAVDGWGITHQCRSFDAIMDFMMENTVANSW